MNYVPIMIIKNQIKSNGQSKLISLDCPFYGGGEGIRTPVPLRANGFQDRLVMTASIRLHNY